MSMYFVCIPSLLLLLYPGVASSCSAPPLPEHTLLINEGPYVKGEIIQFECERGYMLESGRLAIRCNENRRWVGSAPVCKEIICTEPDAPDYTIVTSTGPYNLDSKLKYTCEPNFKHTSGDLTRLCLQSETFSGVSPTCTVITCPTSASSPDSATEDTTGSDNTIEISSGPYEIGDNIRYKCETGWKLDSGLTEHTRTCLATEQFDGTAPVCIRKKCDAPPTLKDGTYHPRRNVYRPGDTVTAVCAQGFQLDFTESATRVCNESETWNATDPTCIAIPCGAPPIIPYAVSNATWLRSSYPVGTTVTYDCISGYSHAVGDTLICVVGPSWNPLDSTTRPYCREQPDGDHHKSCSPPFEITWGSHDGIGGSFLPASSVVTYTCDLHYQFPDKTTRQFVMCQSDGTWDKVIQDCEVIQCPPLPVLHHLDQHPTTREAGSFVTFFCHIGHEFPDGSTIRSLMCSNEGVWSNKMQSCQAKECDKQPHIEGTLTTTKKVSHTTDSTSTTTHSGTGNSEQTEAHSVGDRIDYDCDKARGRAENGAPKQQTECTSQGKWSSPPTECEAERCTAPPLVQNATLIGLNVSHEGISEFFCHPGNRFPDGRQDRQILCVHGEFNETEVPPCSPINCPPVPRFLHSDPDTILTPAGSTVNYKCHHGYSYPNATFTNHISCTFEAEWDRNISDCEEIVCRGVPSVERASPNTTHPGATWKWQETLRFTCDTGLRFIDGHTTHETSCNSLSEWNIMHSGCKANRCPPVPDPSNAIANTDVTDEGMVVMVTCNPGYRYPDDSSMATITCQNTLKWSPLPGDCQIVSCAKPENILFATTTFNGTTYGSQADYTCNKGYLFNTKSRTQTATCDQNKMWTVPKNSALECIPVECPRINFLNNTVLSTTDHHFGMEVYYSCYEGYLFKGTRQSAKLITCQDSGEWSELLTEGCEAVQCPLPVWADILFNTTTYNGYKAVLNYSCAEGMKFSKGKGDTQSSKVKERSAVCQMDASWSPDIIGCSADTAYQLPPQPVEAEKADKIGTVTLACVCTLMVIILAVDVATFGPKIVQHFARLFSGNSGPKPQTARQGLHGLEGHLEVMDSPTRPRSFSHANSQTFNNRYHSVKTDLV